MRQRRMSLPENEVRDEQLLGYNHPDNARSKAKTTNKVPAGSSLC